MKSVFKTLIICIMFQGCQSQSNFDLTEISLKKDKINEIVPKDAKVRTYSLGITDNAYIGTKAKELLKFNGVSLVGRQDPDSNRGVNGLTLYYNKKDSIIYKYQVFIYSETQAIDLLATLKLKLGEPNYTKYMRFGDKEKDNFSALLWEDKKNSLLYKLNYSLDESEKAKLEVKVNSSDIKELNLFGPFGYWEDYLYVRKRKNNSDYTYQDFLVEKLKRDPNDVRAKLTK